MEIDLSKVEQIELDQSIYLKAIIKVYEKDALGRLVPIEIRVKWDQREEAFNQLYKEWTKIKFKKRRKHEQAYRKNK